MTSLAIIGGGIVGLSTAISAVKDNKFKRITLFEKDLCGAHNSGKNSGVIHAGIYYKPNTLRAKLCVEGSRELRKWCNENDLLLLETGKLIVPTTINELNELNRLKNNADKNGAETYIIKSKKDIHSICEEVNCYQDTAIWSPNTYNCNPIQIISTLKDECISLGVDIKEGFNAKIVKSNTQSYHIETNEDSYFPKTIINTAGQHADLLARSCNSKLKEAFLPVLGRYFECIESENWHLPKANIYPVPNPSLPFLGLHVSPYWNGQSYAGPTAIPVLAREAYNNFKGVERDVLITIFKYGFSNLITKPRFFVDYLSEEFRHLSIFEAAKDLKKMFPTFQPDNLMYSTKSGIRPQLVNLEGGDLINEFRVLKDLNTLHVLNCISPAFTASFPLGRYIYGLLDK